jgi:hypothetical protein
MDRRAFAVWIVLAGLIVGLLGNIMFFGHYIGLSFPFFTLVVIAVLLGSSLPAKQPLRLRNLWPLIPLLFFATMIALRADIIIVLLDFFAVIGLGALTLHYLSSERQLDEDSLADYSRAVNQTTVGVLGSSSAEYSDAWIWWKEHGWRDRQTISAVLRGLMITIPVVIVFTLLLASADVVFGKFLGDLFEPIAIKNVPTIIARLIFVLIIAWLTTGALSYALARRSWESFLQNRTIALDEPDNGETEALDNNPSPTPEPDEEEKLKPVGYKLGIIEATILLGALDLLFGIFVLIQLTYFFGGEKNIEGYTYAEYARRGFFELVAVSVLTLGLVLILDTITVRRGNQHHNIFRGLAVGVVILMGIMLISASQRMGLYEDAFGYTRLRVFVHIFIFWLGALFLAFTLEMFRIKTNLFSLGVLLIMVGYLGTLNLINIDQYISSNNMKRFEDGKQLDVCYLQTLSTDAIPAMVELRDLVQDEDTLQHIDWWLRQQLYNLDNILNDDSIFAYNWSRDRAWNELNAIRDTLPRNYDSSWQYWSCSTYVPR